MVNTCDDSFPLPQTTVPSMLLAGYCVHSTSRGDLSGSIDRAQFETMFAPYFDHGMC
jgi:hypothetical protein